MIQIVRLRYRLNTKFTTDPQVHHSAKSFSTIDGEVNLRAVRSRDLDRRGWVSLRTGIV